MSQPGNKDVDVPLSKPYYGASLPVAFKRFWKKYPVFTGRASRSEYCWAVGVHFLTTLILVIGGIVAGIPGGKWVGDDFLPGTGFLVVFVILILWLLGSAVPMIGIMIRRMHDANFSGGFIFLGLIPGFGGILLLIFLLMPSSSNGQRFDFQPEQPDSAARSSDESPKSVSSFKE